jgi:hypothetical protein
MRSLLIVFVVYTNLFAPTVSAQDPNLDDLLDRLDDVLVSDIPEYTYWIDSSCSNRPKVQSFHPHAVSPTGYTVPRGHGSFVQSTDLIESSGKP